MQVYVATNDYNGKLYVGKTEGPLKKRMGEHKRAARARTRIADSVFHRAIAKYGIGAFSVIVLGTASTPEELAELEKHFIRVLKTKVPYGYNLTDGGEGLRGYVPTAETRARLSASSKGRRGRLGIPQDVEARANISAGLLRISEQLSARSKSLWENPDFRARQIAARKGKPLNLTPEQRARRSANTKAARAARFWSTTPKKALHAH